MEASPVVALKWSAETACEDSVRFNRTQPHTAQSRPHHVSRHHSVSRLTRYGTAIGWTLRKSCSLWPLFCKSSPGTRVEAYFVKAADRAITL